MPRVAGKEAGVQKRVWKQLTGMARGEAWWLQRKHFHDDALAQIAAHIRQSEAAHTGELMLAIETVTPSRTTGQPPTGIGGVRPRDDVGYARTQACCFISRWIKGG